MLSLCAHLGTYPHYYYLPDPLQMKLLSGYTRTQARSCCVPTQRPDGSPSSTLAPKSCTSSGHSTLRNRLYASVNSHPRQPPTPATMIIVEDPNPAVHSVQHAVRGELAIKAEEFRDASKNPQASSTLLSSKTRHPTSATLSIRASISHQSPW